MVTSPTARARSWGGRLAQRLTAACLATWGDVCHLCGRAGADTADHLIPRAGGGPDALPNLRPAHRPCNSRRGDRPLAPARLAALLAATDRAAYARLVARPATPTLDATDYVDV